MIVELTNHLWQSTLFGVVAALLAFTFRKNRAQFRYSLLLNASLQFLIPFLVLVSPGSRAFCEQSMLYAARYRYPLKISSTNPHILVDQNNVPFLIVGDAPQTLIVNVTTTDAAIYLDDRSARRINSLWIEVLCVEYGAGRADASLLDGTKPFTKTIPGTNYYDLTAPNKAYFDHAYKIIQMASERGMAIFLDPMDPTGFMQTALANGPTRTRAYGQYLGKLFKKSPNIIWMSGADFTTWRNPADDAVMTAIALGIKDEDPNNLQTIELSYQASCSLDDPRWASIVGLNLTYTYYATYAEVLQCYNQSDKLPTLMGEANYEYERNGDEDGGSPHVLRMQEYWSMLSGVTGQLYGNKYFWKFIPGWKSHLCSPGIIQLGYMQDLFAARKWYDLVPDQNHRFVTAGYGHFISTGPPATATTARFADNDYVTAALTQDGTLGMAYLPQGGAITVDMSKLQSGITARWFDPAEGAFLPVADSPFSNQETHQFTSPGKNNAGDFDWVLVLEAGRQSEMTP
jgi:Protein of unknown function (DUF4038)/Putative collagen-binding domain of a collagenase